MIENRLRSAGLAWHTLISNYVQFEVDIKSTKIDPLKLTIKINFIHNIIALYKRLYIFGLYKCFQNLSKFISEWQETDSVAGHTTQDSTAIIRIDRL